MSILNFYDIIDILKRHEISKFLEIYVAEHPEKSFNEYTSIFSLDIDAENLNKLKSGRFIVENGVLYLEDISNGDFCGRGRKDNFEIIEGACS